MGLQSCGVDSMKFEFGKVGSHGEISTAKRDKICKKVYTLITSYLSNTTSNKFAQLGTEWNKLYNKIVANKLNKYRQKTKNHCSIITRIGQTQQKTARNAQWNICHIVLVPVR